MTAASGGGADEAGADNNAQLLVASFQWVLEPYFCGWPKDEASHCSEYCSTRLNSLRDLPHPGPAVLHSVAPRDEQQQHPAPAPSPQIEVQPYLSKGTALPSPSECANIPDLSMLPAAAASLDPWAPACSGTQPPAYDLLNATLDVARELLFAENKTNSPACAGIILLGLELACAQVHAPPCAACGMRASLHGRTRTHLQPSSSLVQAAPRASVLQSAGWRVVLPLTCDTIHTTASPSDCVQSKRRREGTAIPPHYSHHPPCCHCCLQTARSEEGAELGTVVHLLVGIDCFDKYGSEPCCASDFEGADMRATFFVPAGGSASEAEPVDIEVDRYWSAPWLTVGGPRRC